MWIRFIYCVWCSLHSFFIWLLSNKDKAIDLTNPHESGSIIDIFKSTINANTQITLLSDNIWQQLSHNFSLIVLILAAKNPLSSWTEFVTRLCYFLIWFYRPLLRPKKYYITIISKLCNVAKNWWTLWSFFNISQNFIIGS